MSPSGITLMGYHPHRGSILHPRVLDEPQGDRTFIFPVGRDRRRLQGVQAALWWRVGLATSNSTGRVPGKRQEGDAALMAFVHVCK